MLSREVGAGVLRVSCESPLGFLFWLLLLVFVVLGGARGVVHNASTRRKVWKAKKKKNLEKKSGWVGLLACVLTYYQQSVDLGGWVVSGTWYILEHHCIV